MRGQKGTRGLVVVSSPGGRFATPAAAGGSMLGPMYLARTVQGMAYAPSMAIGAVAAAVLVVAGPTVFSASAGKHRYQPTTGERARV